MGQKVNLKRGGCFHTHTRTYTHKNRDSQNVRPRESKNKKRRKTRIIESSLESKKADFPNLDFLCTMSTSLRKIL